MKIKLPDSVSSTQDLKAVILEIRGYARWLSQASVKMKASGANSYGKAPAVSEAAAKLINDWAKDSQLSQKSMDELIVALEDFEATAPSMTITLAAPVPNSLRQTLISWCRTNINPSILVNFKFNSTIGGGMVVTCGSHVFDWSFRRQILAAREKFPEVLRNV